MSRQLIVAAVQMDAAPAPRKERLQRAEQLVAAAAQEGAHLIVLPELFNLGYSYEDSNYDAAETLNDETFSWMKRQAKKTKVHLAGSFLLLDGDHIYNAAFLVAPSGETWRYNKQYPFAWERAFFREDDAITIAETALGKIGLMICWDAGHASVWQRYAGRVDLVVIPSCPPRMETPELKFADGASIRPMQLDNHFADSDLNDQAAWLGVPVVHSGGSGQFLSRFPQQRVVLGTYALVQPALRQRVLSEGEVLIAAAYGSHTKVIDQHGQTLAVAPPGDSYALSPITLADETPVPGSVQPPMKTPWVAYLLSDVMGQSLFAITYRQELRRRYGRTMAPVSSKTIVWSAITAAAFGAGWWLGRRR
jgi:predicted amidohydrolase